VLVGTTTTLSVEAQAMIATDRSTLIPTAVVGASW
jgi:hypothetical protein